jgi:hypothetical protein
MEKVSWKIQKYNCGLWLYQNDALRYSTESEAWRALACTIDETGDSYDLYRIVSVPNTAGWMF